MLIKTAPRSQAASNGHDTTRFMQNWTKTILRAPDIKSARLTANWLARESAKRGDSESFLCFEEMQCLPTLDAVHKAAAKMLRLVVDNTGDVAPERAVERQREPEKYPSPEVRLARYVGMGCRRTGAV